MGAVREKWDLFVKEYLVDLSGAGAARRVGYSAGYGARLLKKTEVRRAVREAMDIRCEKLQLRQEDVLRELGRIALSEASDASGAEVKVGSKLRALELLGKHLGMFEGRGGELERVEIVEDV